MHDGREHPVRLKLSLDEPARLEGARSGFVLEEGTITIGRAPDADWVLADPERILSKAHCRVAAEPQGFVVTDISTNGVFVNGEPVGYEGRRRLGDGDRLRLGDVEIAVTLEAVAPERAQAAAIDTAFDPDLGGPFGAAEVPPPVSPEPIKDDWWAGSPREPLAAARKDVDSAPPPPAAPDSIVISLIQSFPDLDVTTFASAVDAAGGRMPDLEWQGFFERLHAFLQERYPDGA